MVRQSSWQPTSAVVAAANVTGFGADLGLPDYESLYQWSVDNRGDYWLETCRRLGIVWTSPPDEALDLTAGVTRPVWMPGATLNIVDSCFTAPEDSPAIVYSSGGSIHTDSYADLRSAVNRVANGLHALGYGQGSRIAIAMPMSVESVYAYLAIVAIGGAVVSIADSFAGEEIATRLAITGADLVITQDVIHRSGKQLPMFAKVCDAGATQAVVVDTGAGVELRAGDRWWRDVLGPSDTFEPVVTSPDHHINILFSSGTTGEPKAIPWTQLTPIKAAADGHFHLDIRSDDVVAWPTNLGWMMGPWLIFSSLINGATMTLFDDAPTSPAFGRFVSEVGITVLGLVPSIVAAWRSTDVSSVSDWKVRVLASTGEASNADDMAWLMEHSGAPVIEYCGGTEIGGGYISGTVVQPAVAGAFSTPVLGMGMVILDDDGCESDMGEIYLIPPSIGLSTELLNRDHDAVYYADVPAHPEQLRRHGDQMEHLGDGYYRAHGRVDDTMNLGGIKVSSAEIERAVADVSGVSEVAAIAVTPPGGGPSQLVLYAVSEPGFGDADGWHDAMQRAIRTNLNPLFKVRDVVRVETLPRTASAKVMRRSLRADYGDRQRHTAS